MSKSETTAVPWNDADVLERLRRISAGEFPSVQQSVARQAIVEIERLRASLAEAACLARSVEAACE